MKNIGRQKPVVALFTVYALANSSFLTAQDEDTAKSNAVSYQGQKNQLEEIIVTARLRQESLQDVPVAVNALSKNMIKDLRIQNVQDMATFVPGLDVGPTTNSSGGGLYLRGIGSTEAAAFIDQALAITIDGVQVNDARIMSATMLDLEQVEVLRGPQALFYGKNSPAGVVSIRTADPGDEFELNLSLAYEFEAEQKETRFVVSGPITDTFGARLALSYSEQKGLINVVGADADLTPEIPLAISPTEDSYDKRDDIFVRGTLLFEPSEKFHIRGKYSYFDRKGGSITWAGQRFVCPFGEPQARIQIDDCEINDTTYFGQIHPSILETFPQADPDEKDGVLENTQHLASIDMEYRFDNGLTLTSISSYYETHQYTMAEGAFEPVDTVITIYDIELEHLSQELRLASDWDGNFNFLAGVYYETREGTYDHVVPGSAILRLQFLGQPIAFSLGDQYKAQEGTSISGFIQTDWDINNQLGLSVGGRYSIEKKEFEAMGNGVPAMLDPDDEEWTNFSPEVTLTYRPYDEVMFYISYKEGFKSGGFDSSFQPNRLDDPEVLDLTFDEEVVTGFELGMKSRLLDNDLTLNAVAFTYDYDDLQVAVSDPVSLSSATLNAAKAKVEGVELDVVWLPVPSQDLSLNANVTYLDNQFEDFIGPCWTGQTIALGCNRVLNPVTGAYTSQDLSGNDLPFSQNWNASFGFNYEWSVTPGIGAGLTGNATYTGDYETMLQYAPDSKWSGFWQYHASVKLYSKNERWEVALQGRNLTNEFYPRRVSAVPLTGSGSGVEQAVPADLVATVLGGRTITLDFTFRM